MSRARDLQIMATVIENTLRDVNERQTDRGSQRVYKCFYAALKCRVERTITSQCSLAQPYYFT